MEFNLSTPYDISSRSYAGDGERCTMTEVTVTPYDLEFNHDGTKLFVATRNATNGPDKDKIFRYDLTTPYDISTSVSAGDSARCQLTGVTLGNNFSIYDLAFSSDGMRFFVVNRHFNNNTAGADEVAGFDLTSPYDISTCTFGSVHDELDTTALTTGSNAGDFDHTTDNRQHKVQSVEINDDGTKLFLLFFDNEDSDVGGRLYEYNLSTPYDVSTLSLVLTCLLYTSPSPRDRG